MAMTGAEKTARWEAANPEKCRAVRSASRRRLRDSRRRFLDSVKSTCGCIMCGEQDFIVLRPHHPDPASKLSAMRKGRGTGSGQQGRALLDLTWGPLQRELEKCVILCGNCHLRADAT